MNRSKSEIDCEMLDQDQIDLSSGDGHNVRKSLLRRAGLQLKKGPWTPSEDAILEAYVKKHGERNWNAVAKNTSLLRCGKSCRLRWANHLRPNLKKGAFTKEEENLIIKLHSDMGNKWARMAAYLPGRTDNEIKNYWNTRIKKCQRTRTPIYPGNICRQVSNEDQHDSTDFSFTEKLATDLLHGNGLHVPKFTCNNFIDCREALSYAPQLSDVSISNVLDQSFAPKNYGFMDQVNQVNVLKDYEISLPVLNTSISGMFSSIAQYSNKSEKSIQAFGFDRHYATNCSDKTMVPSAGAFFGSHAFSNGNFYASRPTSGPLKIELPSVQDSESDPNNWSTYSRTCSMQPENFADLCTRFSAAILSQKPECMAPRNSGQLAELLPEAHAFSSVENLQLYVGSLSSSVGTSCDMMESSECEEYWEQDPNFYTLINSSFSAPPLCPASPDEFQHSEISSAQSPLFYSSEPMVPQYDQGKFSCHQEDFRPDGLFSWNTIIPSVFSETTEALVENDADTEWKKPVSCGTTIFPK